MQNTFSCKISNFTFLREDQIKKLKKILSNSIENIDVLFEHSNVKVDTSKAVFLFMSFLKKDVHRVMLLKEFKEP